MQQKSLSDFADQLGQGKLANLLKITQGALSKAIRTKRNIFVYQKPDGSIYAEEVKPFPCSVVQKKDSHNDE